MSKELIYAVKDGSVWQSVTKSQYSDQTNWTKYTVKEFNLGLSRIEAIGNGDNDIAITEKELYVYPKIDGRNQSRFKPGEEIYITSDEFPNGKLIKLGAREVEKGIFRHQPSLTEKNLIVGHSLSKNTKTDINDFNNVIYKNTIKWDGIESCLDADSPYVDEDSNPIGKCIISGKNQVNTNYDPFWTNGDYKKANRYFSFFIKVPKDVEFKDIDDNTKSEFRFLTMPLGDASQRNASRGSAFLSVNPDGKLRFRIFNNNSAKNRHEFHYSDNNDVDTFEIESDGVNLLDDKWHHIVINFQDDGTFIAYVDNTKVFDGYNRYLNTSSVYKTNSIYYLYLFPGTNADANYKKWYAGIDQDYQITPDGVKLAQIEVYNDTYNPNKDYVFFKRDENHLDELIKYDISDNNLSKAPVNVYRKNNAVLHNAMVNVGENIEDQWAEGKVIAYSIQVDPNQTFDETVQPIDRITYSYDVVYKEGRNFTQKINCDLGDVIMPAIITQLEV